MTTLTLDQQRAQLAFQHIGDVKRWDPNDEKKPAQRKYASMVNALPALVRRAGLSQALHFVKSRKSDDQKKILDHLAEHVARRVDAKIQAGDALLQKVRAVDLEEYLLLTQEILACLVWYRRFVQGELGLGDERDVHEE